MRVESLDHVNILTADVGATSRFFAELLDLKIGATPGIPDTTQACWLYDAGGRAMIHLGSTAVRYPGATPPQVSAPGSGRIHHVALRCAGYQSLRERLDARGLPYEAHAVPQAGLRQLFVHEPNGILLELNFFGD